jgi:uridine phosphorylase
MIQPKVIAESELIITAKGTVYHLDLGPEHLADTVVTVGDPGRVKEVTKYFDRIEHKAQHREFITHTGYVGNKRLSVISTGIGTGNIDIVLNELDALAKIDLASRQVKPQHHALSIIRLGSSGALQSNIPVDSLVVSSHGIGLDNIMHYYQFSNSDNERYILDNFEKHTGLSGRVILPYIAEASIGLRKHFGAGYTHGITVTCPGFYGPQGRVLRGPLAFPNLLDALTSFNSGNDRITNFEMETSAIYGLGKLLGHHCLSINAIVANRVQKTFSKDSAAAIDNMIKHSLEIIERI